MMRITFDIKCHNGQFTINPKIYCKGLSSKEEDNISELLAAIYATGLGSNIEKAGKALTDEINPRFKYCFTDAKRSALAKLVAEHGYDVNLIYKDTGDPIRDRG